MSAPRPVVGISTYGRGKDAVRFTMPVEYVEAVRRAGAIAVLVPPGDDDARAILERIDGLVLAGGGDIESSRYGQARHATSYGVDPERDASEIALVCEAMRRQTPVLAICRGLQVVNVACGGDLVQHLPDVSESVAHRAKGKSVAHRVRVDPASLVARVAGTTSIEIASFHHQAVRRVGDGLEPVAWADDDTIEALEAPANENLLAIQWHPEETAGSDVAAQRLFDWLAARALERLTK